MNHLLPLVAALAGLPLGFWARDLAIRHSVGEEALLGHACPRCATAVGGGPVASLRLAAGRCPGCRARIGPPPLVAEVLTAVTLAALASRYPWPELAAYGWLTAVTVALVAVDVAVHRLPDRLTAAAFLGTVAPLTAAALTRDGAPDLARALLGGLVLTGLYLLLFLVNPEGMGLGDVKFAAALGVALGRLGWDALVTGAFLGFLAGGLYGGALVAARRAGRGSEIPFGPFMAAGAFAVILTAQGIR
ncbi:A24 family peptidase [Streptosporangium sp. NPDC020145]|uniref:prepilin peptidase n=1 Tax=Streptosporangium sp. NPDC020145 TaxID=3154694 RepID=UPI0034220D0E